MSSVFGLNKPNTDLKKNVFDLSAQNLFTLSAGMLLPCMCREMNPGEKAQISLASLTRTQPLNTAAFVRSRQFYHFFFVPYRQLWSGWDNFITGMDYRTSSIQKTTFNSRVPSLDIFGIIKKLVADGYFGVDPTSTSDKDKDELGFKYDLGVSRLLDMLGYGFRFEDSATNKRSSSLAELFEAIGRGKASELATLFSVADANKVLVNPFRLLAYQKIYSDFYKRDDYEGTDPLNFNLDDFDGKTPVSANVDAKRLLNMMRLRYRWLPKDYFTGVVPSELFNVGNLDPNKLLPETRMKFDNYNLTDIFNVTDDGITLQAGTSAGKNSSFGNISTRSIRAAFAIEKMLRISRRAGAQDYISQISAHYGFDVPQGRGDKVDFIDGWSSSIDISEVLTTANTTQGFTGQIAGKGLGSTELGKEIHYTAKEHGVLMCITSVVPDTEYSAEGMNRFNLKFERGDYFQPELQDLGLQPVLSDELLFTPQLKNKAPLPAPPGKPSGSNRLPSILGYAPRYCEYKACYDELHGEFRNGRSLSAWSSSTLVAPASYNPSSMTSGVSVSSLLVNPKCLDRVFSVNFDGSEKTDQFMCAMQIICKMIRPMSITGQQL